MVYHLREESSDSDSLAFVDVVQGGTQTLHNGGQPGTGMLSHCPIDKTNKPKLTHTIYTEWINYLEHRFTSYEREKKEREYRRAIIF